MRLRQGAEQANKLLDSAVPRITEAPMAKYGRKAQEKVEAAMHEFKEGKLKSGGSGRKVKNPKQAIAIGLSEARRSGAKVPSEKPQARGKAEKKKAAKKKSK